jgi:NhaA family Na+:H+ antiporter
VLLLFGFANAGVPFEQIGAGTWYVLAGLLIGKPLGIGAAAGVSKALGGHLPSGLGRSELIVLGIAASIGFTVSLFFATAAFPAGAELSETKMGALLSLVAAPMAVVAARVLRVTPIRRDAAPPS